MSNFKKMVESRMTKTNESWQTAARNVRAQAAGGAPPAGPPPSGPTQEGPRSVPELLALFHAPSTFEVLVGRMPAVAAGADLQRVIERSNDLARNPRYYAKSGGADYTVSLDEHDRLIAAGALDDRDGQMIRSHRFVSNFEGTTFSDRCEKCDRWIWCGEKARTAKCVCGHPYRVAFDLLEHFAWEKTQYARCADCGARYGMHPIDAPGRSPWRPLNEWQVQCNTCHGFGSMTRGKLRALGPKAADAGDDFDVALTSWSVEKIREAWGQDELIIRNARVATVPSNILARRRYGAITAGGVTVGPVVIETPPGDGPVRLRVGDRIDLRLSYRGA